MSWSGLSSANTRWQLLLALVVFGTWTSWAEAGKIPGDAQLNQIPPLTFAETSEYFDGIYRNFYENYKLGPGDEIAVRVASQPDFTLERVRVSPTGRIYHPLLGNVHVAHLTVEQLTGKLASEFSEYILKPSVNVELLAAQSAKIGVLGDVIRPGIVVMAEPMTVLGAITASGGVADTGKKSEVTLLRQGNEGHLKIVTINLKRILKGEADPEQNLVLKGGDTLIVHGNLKKKITSISAPFVGLTQLLYFLAVVH